MPWTYCDRINGQTITYDENGLRLSKTTGGVTTKIYRTNGQMVGMNSSDGKDLMFLLDGSGNVYGLHYDHYSSEAQTAAATYYFAYNAQGDVIGIYDASGTVVATYAYDEWGNCTVQVLAADGNGHAADSPDHIAQVNPFRYRGYYYDNETGLYYLNSRYYDPETYRFLNADGCVQTGQGILDKNMFAYCLNNPIVLCDSTGAFPSYTITFPAEGDGDVIIDGLPDSYEGSVDKKNNTYIVEVKKKNNFVNDVVNPIVTSTVSTFLDDLLNTMVTALQVPSVLSQGASLIRSISAASNIGLVSLGVAGVSIISDYVVYWDDPATFGKLTAITVASTTVSALWGAFAASTAPAITPAGSFALAVVGGVLISAGESWLKNRVLERRKE